MPKLIRLAVVDYQLLFRKALMTYLSHQPNFQVVAEASVVSELLPRLKDLHIDVLLLEMFPTEWNGNGTINMIENQVPNAKILILFDNLDLNLIGECLDAGIYGYISKADDPDDLVTAIFDASNGKIFRNKYFTEALYSRKQDNTRSKLYEVQSSLNEREKKILQLIWEEKSNREIGNELFLGVRSIEKIRQELKEKVGVRSTVGLLKYGLTKKLIVAELRH